MLRKVADDLEKLKITEAIQVIVTPYDSDVFICGDLYGEMPDGCTLTSEPFDDEWDQMFYRKDGVKYFTLTRKFKKEDENGIDNL